MNNSEACRKMFPAAGGEREDLVGQRGRRDLCRGVQGKKNVVKVKLKSEKTPLQKSLRHVPFYIRKVWIIVYLQPTSIIFLYTYFKLIVLLLGSPGRYKI